jgi:outer membrane biosynthesis protein TonB
MKITTQLVILAVVLFIVIMLSLSYFAVEVMPYSPSTIFSKQFVYEGMETENKASDKPKEKSDDEKLAEELAKLMEESKTTEPKTTEPKTTEPKTTEPKKEEPKTTEPKKEEPKTTEPKKVEGFQGLQPSPYVSETPIDPFGQTPGSLECDSRSSGLHNSRGGLCLTKEQLNLLKTRGGNSTGGDFQIGSSTLNK